MAFLSQSFSSGLASYETTPALESFIGITSLYYIDPTLALSFNVNGFGWIDVDDPDVEEFQPVKGHVSTTVHRYYHFRFIPIPSTLSVNNPSLNTDIPFRLWNTFPRADELVSGSILNTTVVTTDLTVGSTIRDFELVEYNIQIGGGEAAIDAELVGVFDQGSFTLGIIGTLIVDMPLIPDDKASETWTWKTAISVSYNNTEQRVRLAPGPVRIVEYSYETDEEEMVEVARRLFQSTVGLLTVPFYHYQTKITQQSLSGDDELFFNPLYTNLKVGDTIYLRDPTNDGLANGIIQVVESLTPTGCIIEGTLGSAIEPGWIICPAFALYIEEPTQTFESVSGTLRLTGRAVDRSRPLLRDGATSSLTLFRGAPVLDKRTLAGITEGPINTTEEFGSSFGAYRRLSSWPYPQFQRAVRFFCNMRGSMMDFEWWTLFFDTIAGSHKAFYLPSGLRDLEVQEPPINTGNSLGVKGTSYSTLYFDNPTYKQLAITFPDGTVRYYTVASASPVGGNDVLTVTPDFPADVETNGIGRISYLYKVRLASDSVQADFQNNRAYFSFGVVGTST